MDASLPFPVALETRWVGHPLHFVPEVDSTSSTLLQRAAEGASAGTVVLTEYQRAGRGRRGHRWESPTGSSLMFSLLLRPERLLPRHALLPILAGVALARTLERHLSGLEPRLKWPNDLWIDDRKAAGILVESESGGPDGPRIVIGMGVNVNQTSEALAALPGATSLAVASGSPVERGALFAALLGEMERALDAFETGWSPRGAWRRRDLLLDRNVVVIEDKERWEGTARDLSDDGALIVEERKTGRPRAIRAAEVRIRPASRPTESAP